MTRPDPDFTVPKPLTREWIDSLDQLDFARYIVAQYAAVGDAGPVAHVKMARFIVAQDAELAALRAERDDKLRALRRADDDVAALAARCSELIAQRDEARTERNRIAAERQAAIDAWTTASTTGLDERVRADRLAAALVEACDIADNYIVPGHNDYDATDDARIATLRAVAERGGEG